MTPHKRFGVQYGLLLILLTVFGLNQPILSAPLTYQVKEDPGNWVEFTSDAPIELIHGKTNRITGQIQVDDAFAFDEVHPFVVKMEVDLASFDTGIPLRNEHMRDNFLEAKKYPKAVFEVQAIETESKPPIKLGQSVQLNAKGRFTLHGVTTTRSIPVKVTNRGQFLRIQSTFPVALKDYRIKRPEVIFQKLADTIFVTLDIVAARTGVSPARPQNYSDKH